MENNILPFEMPNEDPIERARRIMNSKLDELSKLDLETRLDYEEKQNRKFDDIRDLKDDLMSYLVDYGYSVSMNEMKRDFYLKYRLSEIERENMLKIFGIMKKSAIYDKLSFGYAVFGVGSSVYSDKFYEELEEGLRKEGISLEDFVVEEAGTQWDQYSDFENYEEYLEKYTEENKSRAFDEQLSITTKENFYKVREQEQKDYKTKKKLKEILERKGEDLDFVIYPDGYNMWEVLEYTQDKMKEFRRNFKRFSEESGIKYSEETSYLAGHDYGIFEGVVSRYKEIEDVKDTCRVEFPNGRSFHFYFEDCYAADKKLRDEQIRNYPFVQLLRRNNFEDLKETILYGEETGVYENPKILKFLGRR